MMFQLIMVLLLFLFTPKKVVCQGTNTNDGELNFNGGKNLYTTGSANLNNNGLLTLTNSTPRTTGQVFYNRPLQIWTCLCY
ncbi:BnaC06g24930D [Brassica napus]|uniref:BnaC06g24930D protein n=1 Tax=Brassica napus TaxID=3708 RepID=A0A078GDZ3_BRANA|nr:BnaC06g24930D [Brassica napus]